MVDDRPAVGRSQSSPAAGPQAVAPTASSPVVTVPAPAQSSPVATATVPVPADASPASGPTGPRDADPRGAAPAGRDDLGAAPLGASPSPAPSLSTFAAPGGDLAATTERRSAPDGSLAPDGNSDAPSSLLGAIGSGSAGSFSPPSTGLFLALLLTLFCLPCLRYGRIVLAPARCGSAPFLSLLERPG